MDIFDVEHRAFSCLVIALFRWLKHWLLVIDTLLLRKLAMIVSIAIHEGNEYRDR